jgi:hypothetical protein
VGRPTTQTRTQPDLIPDSNRILARQADRLARRQRQHPFYVVEGDWPRTGVLFHSHLHHARGQCARRAAELSGVNPDGYIS